ncbi:MAG: SulA-family protein [Sphingomonas bacterium]|uniref:TIGR01777 family oxidoreductase n=1 Tax=Sphingomonas bacterium TaxID=1895847 RepID=UPI00261600E6|nr:TIGR01777 family oxidoreductase [Sphingomonas bacterium]MDB5712383.1 SulA-family protein [Sphingomonas bacterium]
MSTLLWVAIAIQTVMGAFDTIWHHEGMERLAWRPSQAHELRLHGVRNMIYALLFGLIGWSEPHGVLAWALIALLLVELFITLWDFVEEDRTRHLPASERVTHTLLTLNYGVILAMLVPLLLGWAALPGAIVAAYHGAWSWLSALASTGVAISGLRDLVAAQRARLLVASDPAPLAGALFGRWSVLVTGGTGFIGRRLIAALTAAGHEVTVLTRERESAAHLPAPIRIVTSLDQIAQETRINAIINLAGEPISSGLWTLARRLRITRSRLATTRNVVAFAARLDHKPDVLINGSAIGWYGLQGDEPLDEGSDGRDCFSRRLCAAWEEVASAATDHGIRTVLLRIGLVLDGEGGMLARMLTPFEFGLGGRFGSGRHYMSWIHRDDLVRLIVHAMGRPDIAGPLNATAPAPVTNAAFATALGRALHRPAILPAPAWPLRLALGAFADELLLGGQRVMPQAALASGFRFVYPTIDDALGAIVGNQRSVRSARHITATLATGAA